MKGKCQRKNRHLFFCILSGIALLLLAGWFGWWHFYVRQDFTLRDVRTEAKADGALLYGKGRMRINLPQNHIIDVHFVIPCQARTGQPLESASTMLFWAPYLGEERSIREGGLHAWALDYARQCGWTVFTFTVEGGGKKDGVPESYYIYPESGWHDVVFAVKAALEVRYGLAPKALLVAGESAGGSLAEHLPVSHPNYIAAAAWSGGTTYRALPESDAAVFFLNNWGCYGVSSSHRLYAESVENGREVLWTEIPPNAGAKSLNHHTPSQLTAQLKQSFLRGAMALADSVTGKVSPPSEWPCEYTMPDGHVAKLPSEEFLRLWERLPHRLNAAVLTQQRNGFVAATEPVSHPEKAAILFYTDIGEPFLQDGVHALCQKNYAVYVVICDDHHEQACTDGAAALAAIRRDPNLSALPLAILGNNDAASAALQLASRVPSTELSGVFLFQPEFLPSVAMPPLSSDGRLNGAIVRSFVTEAVQSVENASLPTTVLAADPNREVQWLEFFEAVGDGN